MLLRTRLLISGIQRAQGAGPEPAVLTSRHPSSKPDAGARAELAWGSNAAWRFGNKLCRVRNNSSTLPITMVAKSLACAAACSHQLQAGRAFTALFAGGGMSHDKVMWPKSQRKSAARFFPISAEFPVLGCINVFPKVACVSRYPYMWVPTTAHPPRGPEICNYMTSLMFQQLNKIIFSL